MKIHLPYFKKKKKPERANQPKNDFSVQQPFALVKYFAFTSLGVFLLAALILVWSFSGNARRTILERSEIYSRMFAESLNRQVFYLFVLPTFVRYERIALSDPIQFEQLDLIVSDIIRGMKIKSVTIFDSRENIVFTQKYLFP